MKAVVVNEPVGELRVRGGQVVEDAAEAAVRAFALVALELVLC